MSPDTGLLSAAARGRISIHHLSSAFQTGLQSCSSHPALGHSLPSGGVSVCLYSIHWSTGPHPPTLLFLGITEALVTSDSVHK